MTVVRTRRGPVSYDSSNHVQVLFKCVGSSWPKVLPFCAANVIIMVVLTRLDILRGRDLGITGQGHSFAAMIVSFLVVSRINTAIERYSECRGYIGIMYRESRELIQNMMVFSRRGKNSSVQSKEWRMEVAYRMMMLLRTSVSVIEFPSEGLPAWEVPELSGEELEYCKPSHSWRRHAQVKHTDYTDSMRVPLLMAFLVRESIVSQEERLPHPMAMSQENKLLNSVDTFLNGYYGMRKFMTTPVPFPLIQMTRTIVLFYVFTLPFVFLNDKSPEILIEHCVVVFMLTYGFMGLELVSIELDDPFGNDANDFDVLAYARMVFEDTFLMIHDADGESWADGIRYRMHGRVEDPVTATELCGLLPRLSGDETA